MKITDLQNTIIRNIEDKLNYLRLLRNTSIIVLIIIPVIVIIGIFILLFTGVKTNISQLLLAGLGLLFSGLIAKSFEFLLQSLKNIKILSSLINDFKFKEYQWTEEDFENNCNQFLNKLNDICK
jgi:hypothetical protein